MIQWIISNIWTIIICAVLIGIVAAIIVSMVRKKRKGKSMVCNCGNCKNCAMHGSCHKPNRQKKKDNHACHTNHSKF